MEKLLSDIELSRSVPVATFLELEAAARSCRCFLVAYLNQHDIGFLIVNCTKHLY